MMVSSQLVVRHRPESRIGTAIGILKQRFGERLSTAEAVRNQHGKGEDHFPVLPPDAVVFAETNEDVVETVSVCAAHKVPVIPFGTGTSLEGHIGAVEGGVSLDLSRMNAVLAVNPEDLDCRVQAGVTRKALNEHLRDTGLFFPIDPGADASLGGMAATRASGTNAVRYGTMRENVISLTVVLADGRLIKTARRSKKSAAGYDLTRLFIGSEGTLGVITEVALRLYGIPEAMSSAVCNFPTLEAAVNTVIATIQSGIPIARIELVDEVQMDAINKYVGTSYPVEPTLFLEFHGSTAAVKEQAESVKALSDSFDGGAFQWTASSEERNKLWHARHSAAYASKALRKGANVWATDECVPISRLAECIVETQADIKRLGLIAPIVGHVGDGNFHVTLIADQEDAAEMSRANEFNERLVMCALAMDGTSTGEHGIGMGKMDFLVAEHGEAVSVMRTIKKSIDTDNIKNPRKVLRV